LKEGDKYIDGCVRTKGKFEHAFGYYVARIQLQKQPGHWSAFWLYNQSVQKAGSDGRGGTEIDIYEKPWLDEQVQQTLHWGGYGKQHKSAGNVAKVPGVMDGWHTFGLLWLPDQYVFYVDGKETWRTSAGGVCQMPLYIKLSDEISNWAGDIGNAELPDQFLVDYMRVYDLVEKQALTLSPKTAPASSPFILGADISWVQQQEDEGTRFLDQGAHKDIFDILKDHKFNWIRLRVFCNPKAPKGYSKTGYCDLQHTVAMAKRIKAAGMGFLLDFHYSNTWADPGHQIKPAAWKDLHGDDLAKAVHDYSKDVLTELKKEAAFPDMVQIGNEISNGFLWPDGQMWKSGDWDAFCNLLKAGIGGVKEVDPSIKIMLHLAWGGQNAKSRSFLDKALAKGVEFDIIGQSYYPRWHGTLDDLNNNLTDLASRYKQDIVVVEYAAPHLKEINDIVHGLPHGKGLGTFFWEPTKGGPGGAGVFERNGATKPEIDIYPEFAEEYGKERQ
jgi:arabinogalactan endo-1,4-beta-galactosidase